jgi:hypothetical protein
MGGLFGGDTPNYTPPPVPAAAPVPTVDKARDNLMSQQEAAMRRGRAANILTSNSGDLSSTSTSSKKLLGG